MPITENAQNYKQLLSRLISINVLFLIFMTITAFLIFIGYNTDLWKLFPKWDIFKVFFQNFRFNLSVICYINIPVFIALAILLGFQTTRIPKLFVNSLKSYYLLMYTCVFYLQLGSYIFRNVFFKNKIPSTDFFAQLVTVYSQFGDRMLITTAVIMSLMFVVTFLFFVVLLKAVLTSKEFEVPDARQAVISTLIVLLFCIFFAKGKLIGHLGAADAVVTPSSDLNQFAINGPYKTVENFKKFDKSNIRLRKDTLTSGNGLDIYEETDEKTKEYEKQMMFKFSPQER